MRAPVTWKTALLLGLLLLASFVRFWGLDWGLPYTYHIDEDKFAGTAMNFFSGDLNPHFFHVPTLHMYTLAGLWKIYYWVGRADGTFHKQRTIPGPISSTTGDLLPHRPGPVGPPQHGTILLLY